MRPVLALDIGGTKIAAALVDGEGRILARERAPTDRGAGPEAALGLAARLGASLLSRAGPALGLGLALPGMTDRERGLLLESPSAGWRDFPFGELLGARLGLPVSADNDVRASARAELRFGTEPRFGAELRSGDEPRSGDAVAGDAAAGPSGLPSFLWMTVSTGIGGALVLEGRLLEGRGGLAGEIGHLVVNEGGAACGCGGRGCLEAEASGTAIARKARAALEAGEASPRLSALEPAALDAAAVAAAARSADPLACRLMAEAGEMIGRALAAAATLLDLEDFILGGGVAAALDLLGPPALAALRRRLVAAEKRRIRLRPSALGYDAALLGAAALALDAFGPFGSFGSFGSFQKESP